MLVENRVPLSLLGHSPIAPAWYSMGVVLQFILCADPTADPTPDFAPADEGWFPQPDYGGDDLGADDSRSDDSQQGRLRHLWQLWRQ